MTAMHDTITLSAMRFEGRHGVSAEERAFPQPFEVDLVVAADLARAAATDDLAATIDYGPLVAICAGVVERNSFRLLESIAGAIADKVLHAAPAALVVTVRVRKLAVPLEAEIDWAQVEITRTRTTA